MYDIFIANNLELKEIIALAKQYEGVFSKHIKVDVAYAQQAYQKLVDSGICTVFGMRKNGVIVGGLAGLIFPDINNGQKTAVECFWFVNKADRGHGTLLLNVFEQWATNCKCQKLALIHLEDSFSETLKKLYSRRGYKLVESHYIKEIV